MMTRRMIPPFHRLKDGVLADYYEMTRDGLPVMVARENHTYDEIAEIVKELTAELTAERDLALGGGKKRPSNWRKQ